MLGLEFVTNGIRDDWLHIVAPTLRQLFLTCCMRALLSAWLQLRFFRAQLQVQLVVLLRELT